MNMNATPDFSIDARRDHPRRMLIDLVVEGMTAGRYGTRLAGDMLSRAGVPFSVACRVLKGAANTPEANPA